MFTVRAEPKTSPLDITCASPWGKTITSPASELDLFLAAHAPVAAALGQDVVRDQVLRGGQDAGRELPRGRVSTLQGSAASTAKKYAPSRRTTRSRSESGSMIEPGLLLLAPGQLRFPGPVTGIVAEKVEQWVQRHGDQGR